MLKSLLALKVVVIRMFYSLTGTKKPGTNNLRVPSPHVSRIYGKSDVEELQFATFVEIDRTA